jgi:hypothetical protein
MILRAAFIILSTLWCMSCSPAKPSEISDSSNQQSPWIRPNGQTGTGPRWGFKNGISVGLWPSPGPRGLIRIYSPYLNQPPGRIMQFIAVEPVVSGTRDLSELQISQTDGKPGKMMWTADQVNLNNPPQAISLPASGNVTEENGIQSLSFFVIVESFDNGARPIVKITFHSDHPHEIFLQTYAAAGSAPMQSCVLTATMGNYGRLRHVELRNSTVDSTTVFKSQTCNDWGFFPWHNWDADQLQTENGQATFIGTGEVDVTTPPEVPLGWRYTGVPARQYWQAAICPGLTARVNGRTTFWSTNVSIPGGPAFENFELMSPFSNGQLFCFGIEPLKESR